MSSCDFDNGNCGWKAQSDNSWIVVNKTFNYDPGHDHTCMDRIYHENCGNWLSTTKKFTDQQEFTLISPQLNNNESESCLSFWYSYFVFARSSFEVLISQDTSVRTAESLWLRTAPQSNNFIYAQIFIPPQTKGFYLFFKAILDSTFNDTVGLDDIVYTATACQRTLDEDFESKHSKWNLNGSQIVTDKLFPDHTTGLTIGHFVLSNGAARTTTLWTSLGNITDVTDSYFVCLKFWYRFFVDGTKNDLNSYLYTSLSRHSNFEYRNISIKSVYEDRLEYGWNEMNVNFNTYSLKDSNISFLMYTKSAQTYIAIDDIKLTYSRCSIQGSCDFETGKHFTFVSNQSTNQFWFLFCGQISVVGNQILVQHLGCVLQVEPEKTIFPQCRMQTHIRQMDTSFSFPQSCSLNTKEAYF